jgi:hypothetical protein
VGTGADARMRTCRRCDTPKPLDAFEEYKPGYRRRVCNECVYLARRAREAANPKLRERTRKQWRRRDAEGERARLRELRRRPDQREKRRQWARRNAEHINAQNRSYRAADRERARALSRRNARHRRLGYDDELCAWSDVLAADPCVYCGAEATGIDHIDPIDAGGRNEWENFAGACGPCNRRKRTTPLLLFLAAR